jgi:hypothetical protein
MNDFFYIDTDSQDIVPSPIDIFLNPELNKFVKSLINNYDDDGKNNKFFSSVETNVILLKLFILADHQLDMKELRTMLKNPKILKACQDILNKKQIFGPKIVSNLMDNPESPSLKDILDPEKPTERSTSTTERSTTRQSSTSTTTTTTTTQATPAITEKMLSKSDNSKLDRRKQMRNKFNMKSDQIENEKSNRNSVKPNLETFNFG